MKRLPFVLIISGLTAILSVGVFWTSVAQAKSTKTFTLEVACNALDTDSTAGTAGFNFSDTGDPGLFGPRATVVVVNGNIYREDSLPSDASAFDPTDPNKIGTWRCLFAALGDMDLPLVGAVTYYFQLEPTGHDSEESMIIVQGLNSHTHMLFGGPDSVPRVLAVVGGTGRFAGATGEVLEEVTSTNASSCFNLRFHFRLRDHRRHHRHRRLPRHHDD